MMWSIGAVVSQGQNIMAYTPPTTIMSMPKRNFGVQTFHLVPQLPIATGKTFGNPNYINKLHPVHNYQTQSNFKSFDRPETKNSSPHIIETLKETRPDIIPNNHTEVDKLSVENSMCNKALKNYRRGRRKLKVPNKNSKHNKNRQQLTEIMELEQETVLPELLLDQSFSPKCPENTHKLSDFIFENMNFPKSISNNTEVKLSPPCFIQECLNSVLPHSESEDSFICFEDKNEFEAPSTLCSRNRQISRCESEDSFIVFDDSCEDEDTESISSNDCTYEESEAEEENNEKSIEPDGLDSSVLVGGRKRVQFADDKKLCEVHPMIKWSYAYQAARKGPWEEYARDRERFKNRICNTECKLKHVFEPVHREKIFKDRFQENNISQNGWPNQNY